MKRSGASLHPMASRVPIKEEPRSKGKAKGQGGKPPTKVTNQKKEEPEEEERR